MRIGVLRERAPRERRVALIPATVQRLIRLKHDVIVERGAGLQAFCPDAQYAEAGASLVDRAEEVTAAADVVLRVHRPELDEVGREIFELVQSVASGQPSKSEALGHQEFILTYKQFEPIGPACLPAA